MTAASETPRQIGVGLISVGWMGKLHTRAFRNLPLVYPELGARPHLVHANDTAPDRAQYAVDVLGYERASLDYRRVLDDPEVDVVSIAAPNFLHEEIGAAAAEAGKHFWIEKPVGRNVEETRRVAAAADTAGVVTSIGFNYRHAPAVEHLRRLVAEGRLGRITNVRGRMFADYSAEPKGALSWRFLRDKAGSGVLGDLVGHLADLVHYTVGPIGEVAAQTSTVYTERPELPIGSGTHFDVVEGGVLRAVENEDYAGILIRLADDAVGAGAVGTLEASRVAVGPRASYGIEIYGTEGSALWDFQRLNELEITTPRGEREFGYTTAYANASFGEFGRFQPGAGTAMGYDDLKVVEAYKFLRAVLGEETANANIHDAVNANAVVSAAERSAATRSWQAAGTGPGSTTTAVRLPAAVGA